MTHFANDLKRAGLFVLEALVGEYLHALLLPVLPLCLELEQRQVAERLILSRDREYEKF